MTAISLTQADIDIALSAYQRDPIGFMVRVLGCRQDWIWDGMVKIARGVRDNERTAVKAGHGVSKSFTAARLALWFLYCFPPATVVTTAPTEAQVKDILWREIREAHAGAKIKLPGEPKTLTLDLQAETGLKWFATGFSCRPDTVTKEATAFHGYHNVNVFKIFDEAAGIMPEIWKASEHVGGNRITRFLAIGNPTSATGDFPRSFKDPGVNCLTIPVTSTPNYIEGSNRIPGLYGREYEQRIIAKYGRDSDEYNVRVLGEISQKAAPGAYYAKNLQWLRDRGRIGRFEYDPRYPVFTVWDPGFTTAIWFFQPTSMGLWHFIRYYEACGEDMGQYAILLDKFRQDCGYRYGQHFAPFDVDNNQYRLVAADGLKEVARRAGILFTDMEMERSVDDGIARTNEFLQSCCFNVVEGDADGCGLGLDRLAGYQQAVNRNMSNEDEFVFMAHPMKNGCEHGADAMRYASKAVRLINPERYQGQYAEQTIVRVQQVKSAALHPMGF